jgi:hypothetical protein
VVVALAFAALNGPSLKEKFEPNNWLFRDGSFYFITTMAMAEHGRIEQRDLQPRSWYEQRLGWNDSLPEDWSNVALGRNGGYYPKHPILLPLLAVPFYWVFGTIGTLFANVLLNLAFVWLIFLLCRRIARVEIAAIIAAIVSGVPFVQAMSYSFSNDLLGADLLLGSLECALAGVFGWSGVLAGLALWSRVTNVMFLPGLMLAGWDRGGLRAVGRAALFSLIPLGLYGALNTYMFGAPWITSYQAVLVREHGQQKVATHTDLFNVPWDAGFRTALTGPNGAFASFPLLAPGLLALPVLAWRRWRLALAILLFCTLPTLLLMKYTWFRPHFLYAIFGASTLGLAAFVQLFVKPAAPVSTPQPPLRLGRPLLIGLAVVTVLALGWRMTHRPDPRLLSTHTHEASVFLDNIPCDYWGPQDERWECSHFDNGGETMIGNITRAPAVVHAEARRSLWLAPSPTRRWHRIVWPTLDAKSVELDFALTDDSRAGHVDIEVLPRGAPAQQIALSSPGEDVVRSVEIQPGDGPALEIRIRADDPSSKHVVVEGKLRREG